MSDEDKETEGQSQNEGPKHVPREKHEQLLKEHNALKEEIQGFRTAKLFSDAQLDWLNPDQQTAVKALAGDGKWTPELLKEQAGKLGFKKEEEKQDPNPANPPTPDPSLSTIDRINRASDQRTPTPSASQDADDFLASLRKFKNDPNASQAQVEAFLTNNGSKFGILMDADID